MTSDEQSIAQKIDAIDGGGMIHLTAEEVQAARRVLSFWEIYGDDLEQTAMWWRRARGVIAFASVAAHFAKWLSIMTAAIIAARFAVLEWLQGGK